ncbi:MAG: hypothetical protein BGO28_00010 [Alphaproteobacteria bacterium 43-37]|nr:MAG: hypothetical protein BGO28_00010 [Alphaproteobacteria bacterium 43-37]
MPTYGPFKNLNFADQTYWEGREHLYSGGVQTIKVTEHTANQASEQEADEAGYFESVIMEYKESLFGIKEGHLTETEPFYGRFAAGYVFLPAFYSWIVTELLPQIVQAFEQLERECLDIDPETKTEFEESINEFIKNNPGLFGDDLTLNVTTGSGG